MSTEPVSHGRGGQGNISPDPTPYTDGEIHREGDPAASGGAYSAGRGGAGNIGSPKQHPVKTDTDDDVVPDAAKLAAHEDEPFHSGRGGEGNVQLPEGGKGGKKPAGGGGAATEGLAEKLKRKLFGRWM
ncbi:hypothetical protein L873DRAFT_1695442 [Choiromyces venosus 120613-1]|uniref:Uncharacterized protein n=1 Tax=Choiromyces venosus 120613-1 TaxID=1336337 RepID=A0A3N4JD77_9PEZI|nr:hypothetical protein L873DRAFT_1695442 [Choiromyces venosus 120613-1]